MSYGQYSSEPKPPKPNFSKPAKRLKYVVKDPQHIWAHPRKKDGSGFEQDNARVPGGNFYFRTSADGTRVMYSYSDSYPIGSRFEQGRKVIFLLRAGRPYGPTTSGHMSATRSAVPRNDKNVEVFTVPAMAASYDHRKPGADEHEANVAAYIADINEAISKFNSSRSSHKIKSALSEAADLTAEVKRYVKVFKLKLPKLPKLPVLDTAKLSVIVERERIRDEKAAAKSAAERAEYEAQRKAETDAWKASPDACKHLDSAGTPIHTYYDRYTCQNQREREDWEATKVEKIAAWKRGENVSLRMGYSDGALLRVVGENVETSQGVKVAIKGPAGAGRLLRLLTALKSAGRTYKANGHTEHIGNFTVTSFGPPETVLEARAGLIPENDTSDWILVAGCHRILWSEVLTVADAVRAVENA